MERKTFGPEESELLAEFGTHSSRAEKGKHGMTMKLLVDKEFKGRHIVRREE